MSQQYIRFPSSSSSGGGNPAAGPTGSPPPADADYIGFNNGTVLVGVSPTTPLPVTFTSGGPVTVVQPSGSNLHVDVDNFPATQAVTQSGTWDVGLNAGSNSIGTVGLDAGSNAIGSVSVSNFPSTQPVSGTVAVTQSTSPWVVSGTVTADAGTGTFAISALSLPLPTSASTSANQTTIISNQTNGSQVTSINNFPATQPVSGTVSVSNFPVTQPVSGTVAVTQSTSPWVVSGTVSTTNAANTNGSVSNSTTISNTGVTTFSPPTNAVGFVIEAESTNTVNLRYAAGTTATNSTGMLLEPGRDSGYIPTAVTVTIIAATTGTGQSAGIQWILSS